MNRAAPLFFAASFLLTSAGCGSAPREDVATTHAPIINGVPSTSADDAAVGIALIVGGSFAGFCSGVMVAENVVLTARHCVSRTDEGAACSKDGKPLSGGVVYSDHKPEELQVLIGPTVTLPPKFDAVGAKIYHPDVNNLCNNDISILVLDHKIAGAKIAPMRLDAPPVKGDTILAVGWGQSNNSKGYGRRRRADIPIIAVGPATGTTIGGAVGSAEFAIGEGICSGDSGGPAFDTKTGAVVGVVSRGTNGAPYDPATDPPTTRCIDSAEYKTHNIYTRTDGFKDLITKAFTEAGSEPWVEGACDPRKAKFAAACDGPAACCSDLCINTGGAQICSQFCSADAPCPDGYTCQPAGEKSVCAPAPPAAPPPPAATGSKGGCEVAPSAASGGSPLAWAALCVLGLVASRRRRALR